MSYVASLTQPVTVQHVGAGAADPYNNPAQTITGSDGYLGRLQAASSAETTTGENTVVTDWILFLPAGAVIAALDRVVDGDPPTPGGRTFEVVGAPDRVWARRREHHVEARLRFIEGG